MLRLLVINWHDLPKNPTAFDWFSAGPGGYFSFAYVWDERTATVVKAIRARDIPWC